MEVVEMMMGETKTGHADCMKVKVVAAELMDGMVEGMWVVVKVMVGVMEWMMLGMRGLRLVSISQACQ